MVNIIHIMYVICTSTEFLYQPEREKQNLCANSLESQVCTSNLKPLIFQQTSLYTSHARGSSATTVTTIVASLSSEVWTDSENSHQKCRMPAPKLMSQKPASECCCKFWPCNGFNQAGLHCVPWYLRAGAVDKLWQSISWWHSPLIVWNVEWVSCILLTNFIHQITLFSHLTDFCKLEDIWDFGVGCCPESSRISVAFVPILVAQVFWFDLFETDA